MKKKQNLLSPREIVMYEERLWELVDQGLSQEAAAEQAAKELRPPKK
jgi:uncharacterized protein YoaH (UPF0181 family)